MQMIGDLDEIKQFNLENSLTMYPDETIDDTSSLFGGLPRNNKSSVSSRSSYLYVENRKNTEITQHTSRNQKRDALRQAYKQKQEERRKKRQQLREEKQLRDEMHEQKLYIEMTNTYTRMIKQLKEFKSSKKQKTAANEFTEQEILNNNRIVKNEVIDMADEVEELHNKINGQDKKMDCIILMMNRILQQQQQKGFEEASANGSVLKEPAPVQVYSDK